MALCITDNLTACSRSDIKKTKSNTETGYKITWYANVLQKNISNEYEVTDKIICNSEYNDAGVRIMEDEIVVAHKSFNEEIIKPDK